MKKVLAAALFLALAVCLEAGGSLLLGKSVIRSLAEGQAVSAESLGLEPAEKPVSKSNMQPEREIPSGDMGVEVVRIQAAAILPDAAGYDFVAQRSGYQSLSEDAKELYAELLLASYSIAVQENQKGYYNTNTVVLEDRQIEEEAIQKTVSALRNDNPQLFWIANVYSYTVTDAGTAVQLYSRIPADQIHSMAAELRSTVGRIVEGMPLGLSEFDREAYLFDQVVSSCSFEEEAAEDASHWKPYTVYGALVEGRAVCEGYSRAMQLLLSYAGMQCRLVDGRGEGQMHMWNLVCVEGGWYHLDVTWSDGDSMVRYNYFNVTDNVIRLDHEIDTACLPACDEERWNYFQARGIRVPGLDDASSLDVAEQLARAAGGKESTVVFYFEENLDYDRALSEIFQDSPFMLLNYIQEANRSLEGYQIGTNNLMYTEARECRGVTLQLYYESKEEEDANG